MKKFFIVLLILIMLGGAGFAGWYFLLRERPLTIEFYGDFETLSYLSGDGSYKENEIVTLTADEREGYDFESWIKDGNPISSSRIYSFVMSKNTSGKYTATYKAKEFTISTQNNGVYNISNKAATDEMVDININPPKGYDVEEIYYVIDGSDEKVVIHNNRFKMPPHHISIFINLKEIKYEIKYDLCGGSFETTTISYYTINTPTFTLPHPTQKGYNFIGYMDKQSTAPILNYQIEQGSTKEISVWAEWELAFFDINTVVEGQGSITISGNAQYQSNEHCGAVAEEGWQLVELYYIASETGDRVDLVEGYFTMPYCDITVYAIFEKIAYNITVSPSVINGYIEPTQTTSYVGDTVTIVAHPDTGCEVLLYKYSIDNEENWIDIEGNTFIMPASDVVIYASFDAIDYQITYNLDGGTLPQDTLTTYRIWDSEVTLPTPTKEGFYFVGWYDNQDFNGENITSFSGYDLENKTFYAYFQPNQYSVAFYNYDGTLLNTISGPWYYGDIPYNWGDAPTKPSTLEYDFVFAGWTPEIVPVVEDASYTAVFTALPRVYTITKADNITKGNIECVTQSVHSETVIVTATPDSGAELIKTYYIKAGDSVENKVEFTNSFVMPKSNVTIYAEFDLIDYDITYNLDGGTLPNGSATSYTIEDIVTLLIPTKVGYDFVGWIINDGDTPNKNITITKGSTGAKEFTAVWQIQTFIIVWINDDGTTIETDANVSYGTTPSFDGETPSKSPTAEYEYIFAGWTPTVAVATQHQTYTATYTSKARTYTITKATIANGTISCVSSAETGDTVTVSVNINEGYRLSKLYYIAAGSTTENLIPGNQFIMPASDVTVYAEFSAISYSINYTLNGGTLPANAPVSYTIEDEVTLVSPTKTGYDFVGWIEKEGASPVINVKIEKGSAGAKNFEALWELATFNILFSTNTGGTLVCESEAMYTESVDVTIIPSEGYFVSRSYYIVDGTTTEVDFEGSFTMPAGNVTVYAEFELAAVQYSITTEERENGTISCVAQAYSGDVVRILITPDDGYEAAYVYIEDLLGNAIDCDIIGWTDDSFSFVMPSINIVVYVEFEEKVYYPISVATVTGGKVICQDKAEELEVVYFTVVPDPEYRLKSLTCENRLTGQAISVDLETCSFTMPVDGGMYGVSIRLTPVFEKIEYTITKANATNGTISCVSSAEVGNAITITATPNNGYQLSRTYYIVEGTTTEVDFEGSFTMPAGNVTVYVVFVTAPYSINIAQTGSATVECVETAEAGTVVTPTITLRSGYEIDKMYYTLGDDETTKTAFRESFTMPNCDINLYVETNLEDVPAPTYSLDVVVNNENLGIAEIITAIPREGLYTVEAIPYEGAEFVGWRQETIDGTLLSTDRVYVASNLDMETIYAIFESTEEVKYTIMIADNDYVNASCQSTAVAGEEVQLIVNDYSMPDNYMAMEIYYITETGTYGIIEEAANPYHFINDISFIMPDENIIIYFEFYHGGTDPA